MSEQDLISKGSVKSYIRGARSTDMLRGLLDRKIRNNLSELLGYAQTIESELAESGHTSGFFQYFKRFKGFKASSTLKVWSAPASYHWNAMCRMLMDATLYKSDHSPILNQYLAFWELDVKQGLLAHLNDFGRFVLAACLVERSEVFFDVPVEIKLPNMIPCTNLALFSADNCEAVAVTLSGFDRDTVNTISAFLSSRDREHLTIKARDGVRLVILKLSSCKGVYSNIIIDSFEPCLNLPYLEPYPRVRDPELCRRFASTLDKALARLLNYAPSLADEISIVIASVTPMDVGQVNAEMCSGTSSAIFGSCFLSMTDEPLYLAEMLLHEFCHNKLRLLEEVAPLIHPDSLGRPQFYSPWRDDPRPLDGIQHGLYVFGSIARFWLSVWNDPAAAEHERLLAQRRVATLVHQLRFAEAEFSEQARLSGHGEAFLQEMSQWIRELENQTREWDLSAMLPFFSGVVRDESLKRLPIVEALPQHQANWQKMYRPEGK